MNWVRNHFSNTKILSVVLSVVLSVFLVTVFAWAATTITTSSVGIATSTPGAMLGVKGGALIEGTLTSYSVFATTSIGIATATPGAMLGVKGAAIVEGFVSADYFTSTSTNSSWIFGNFGVGTTTPGVAAGIGGAAIVEGFVAAEYFTSTSTTNDSWMMAKLGIGTTTVSATLNRGGLAAGGGAIIGDGIATSYIKATSTTASSIGKLGISTTTPWALFAVEALAATTDDETPIFAIGDLGSSSPMMIVNASSSVGFFTNSPRTPFNVHNDVGSSTIYISTGVNYGDVNHGGAIILMDTGGSSCTMLTSTGGELQWGDVTCPAESD